MLTSIGRAAVRRITTTTTRLSPALSQLLSHNVAGQTVAIRAFSVSTWTRLPAAKATSKKTTEAAAPRKAAAKKTTKATATDAEVKPKPKSKPKAKKPKAKKPKAKKPKTDAPKTRKPRAKKPLTPEAQEKHEIRQLKKWSLFNRAPGLPGSAWILFNAQNTEHGLSDLGTNSKELAAKYKNISPSEREALEATVQSNRVTNEANYKAWVESYPVERIYLANKARRKLARKLDQRINSIRDDRLPKFGGHAFSAFVKDKNTGNSLNNISEAMKAVSAEWKALTDAERQSYKDSVAADSARYSIEIKEIREKAKALIQEMKAEEEAKDAAKRAVTAAKAAKYRADKKAEAQAEAELESK
ncbi:hypothetical protein QQZ08_002562 [Neonectria magnoliae]|uniref:HMG box domain-containing protein n=1 Tax=Neonectria magnoliae TaxID=2732573 RepID=A0ABR1ID56_9HYPO